MEPENGLEPEKPIEEPEPPAAAAVPRCPNCGWQNVRRSRSNGALDMVLTIFSISPFRCRSCGTRFRRFARRQAE